MANTSLFILWRQEFHFWMSAFPWALALCTEKITQQVQACQHPARTEPSAPHGEATRSPTPQTAPGRQPRSSTTRLSPSLPSLTLNSARKAGVLPTQLQTPPTSVPNRQQMTRRGAGLPGPWPAPRQGSRGAQYRGACSLQDDRVHLKWPPPQQFPCKILSSPKWRTANAKILE